MDDYEVDLVIVGAGKLALCGPLSLLGAIPVDQHLLRSMWYCFGSILLGGSPSQSTCGSREGHLPRRCVECE